MPGFIKKISEISVNDLPFVGGKNASLGEMFSQLTSKVELVPDGFAITADAYRLFLKENNLIQVLHTMAPNDEQYLMIEQKPERLLFSPGQNC